MCVPAERVGVANVLRAPLSKTQLLVVRAIINTEGADVQACRRRAGAHSATRTVLHNSLSYGRQQGN